MIQRLQNFAVYGVIVDGNRILLVQKSKGPFKGLWDLPGGIIQYGESPETTLLREILEERFGTITQDSIERLRLCRLLSIHSQGTKR